MPFNHDKQKFCRATRKWDRAVLWFYGRMGWECLNLVLRQLRRNGFVVFPNGRYKLRGVEEVSEGHLCLFQTEVIREAENREIVRHVNWG